MYFFGLETEMHPDVRSCIMDANPESNSPTPFMYYFHGTHFCMSLCLGRVPVL